MNAGRSPAQQLRKGVARGSAQLYVRRRTSRRGLNRVLVTLTAPYRYAIVVWGSYRPTQRLSAMSSEVHCLVQEGMRARLGDDWEEIIEEAYEKYATQCAERGQVNIFEVAER
jgi:hypothetical protein